MTQTFQVIFNGALAAGADPDMVKDSLAKLFKTDRAQVENLFSGKTITLKKNIDQDTAMKYQAALKRAGAICEVVAQNETLNQTAPNTPADTVSPRQAANADLTLAPPGVDLLESHTASKVAAPIVENVDFSLAPVGADILEASQRDKPKTREIDLSELSLAPLGSELGKTEKS